MVRIAVIPGDGIANEVVPEAVKVLEMVDKLFNIGLDYELFDFGAERYLKTGKAVPDDFDAFIQALPDTFDTALFGAGGIDPRVPKGVSAQPVLRGLRRGLDLYANVRPCKLLDASITPLKGKTEHDLDFVVIRENTEGYESGTAGNFKVGTPDEVEIRPEYNTYKGVRRVVDFAFTFAQENARSKVFMAQKGLDNGLWNRVFFEVAGTYKGIEARQMHVDTLAYTMIVAPEQLQVIVAENRAGDILSDIGGAIQGSRGIAPTGCFNAERNFCYFEPVHGTGPDIIGQQLANPLAAIRAAGMLLTHFGHRDAAHAIEAAASAVIKTGKVTRDLGGALSTPHAGEALREALRRMAG
jgi:3-isopropylmalate dehydrogenase